MATSNKEKMLRFLSGFTPEDHVLVLINADPDAMASAMALKRLLWRKVASTTISHVNDIKRPDNLSMIRLLGISMVHYRDLDDRKTTRVVIVDSQPDHHDCFGLHAIDAVIDHHPESCAVGRFVDIRPEYGATATILTEYLRSARIQPSARLATALYYAIKTDTANFQRKTRMEDIRAFQYLFRFINPHLERRIDQAEVPLSYLSWYEKALKWRVRKKNHLYVHMGEVPSADLCVMMADFFMRVDKINWSIVSGIVEDRLVVIFRNDGIRKSAGRVAEQSFGSLGSAGGHKGAARAEVPLSAIEESGFPSVRDRRKLGLWIREHVEMRTLKS